MSATTSDEHVVNPHFDIPTKRYYCTVCFLGVKYNPEMAAWFHLEKGIHE